GLRRGCWLVFAHRTNTVNSSRFTPPRLLAARSGRSFATFEIPSIALFKRWPWAGTPTRWPQWPAPWPALYTERRGSRGDGTTTLKTSRKSDETTSVTQAGDWPGWICERFQWGRNIEP